MANRRDFIKTSSLALGGLLIPKMGMAENSSIKYEDIFALRVRKNINSLLPTDPDLLAYKKAVEVMKARPASNPRSWAYQAKIHNDFCPHQNWFFLPWHRAYLKYFEEVCREACGDPNFNLPYWDWTEYPQIPSSFWGADNPLNNTTRKITSVSIGNAEFIGRSVIDDILAITSFEDFASYKSNSPRDNENGGQGVLEARPHNYIHRFVSGDMATFFSPLDPIFWLHHANVDRIWSAWNDKGNSNSSDATFKNYILKSNFYSGEGNIVDVKVGDMFDVRKLGYIYDTQNAKTIASTNKGMFNLSTIAFSSLDNSKSTKKFETLNLEVASDPFLTTDVKKLIQVGKTVKDDKQIKVILSDIEPPIEEDFFVRVFINCDYLDKDTPINDPHFVGSFTFFASNHSHETSNENMHHDHTTHTRKLKFVFDITETLKKVVDVATIDSIKDSVKVQLLPIPLGNNSPGKLVPGKIEIVVAEKIG